MATEEQEALWRLQVSNPYIAGERDWNRRAAERAKRQEEAQAEPLDELL